MSYVYPANQLDRASHLLALLGSHWQRTYQGNDVVEQLAYSRGRLEYQSHLDVLELMRTTSRFETPIFHTDQWYLLTLKESERNGVRTSLLRYGDGAVHGNQPDGALYKYGVPSTLEVSEFPLPDELREAKLIFNRIASPSATFVENVDFKIDVERGAIVFANNPFDNSLVSRRELLQGSDIVDREAALWVFRGQFDWGHVYTHFGYVLNAYFESSTAYRDMVNAVFDALVGGTATEQVQLAIAAATGIPLVKEPIETVEDIAVDGDRRLVITDQNVYTYHLDATPIVAIGDTVTAGDSLTDTVRVYEFNRGQLPADVMGLAMGRGFISAAYYADLLFLNESTPLVVETNVDGYTKVSFEIGGWPLDVEAFWNELHANGVAAGQTLANLLDQRTNKTGQPTAAALPAAVNPLEFLCQHVLRHHAFLVVVKVAELGSDGLGMESLRLLRKIVPPWTAMIVLTELEGPPESVILDSAASELEPGYDESGLLWLGLSPQTDAVPHTMVSEQGSLRRVNGVCR